MQGVILYGPPAAGKTSVAQALEHLHPQYVSFRRLKAGVGRTAGYRMTTVEDIDALDASGDIIWRNERYGATYAVDRSGLLDLLDRAVPVVQLGQREAIGAVVGAIPEAVWYVVSLRCSRELAVERMRERGDVDLDERLSAWDRTEVLHIADSVMDAGRSTPGAIAQAVHDARTR